MRLHPVHAHPENRFTMTPPGETLPTAAPEPTVFVVDDDEALVRSLHWLIESVQLKVETFPSAQAFLDHFDASRPGCLVLDVRMPGMSGLDLQRRLCCADPPHLPILFITGHGDIQMAMRAVKAGAFDFLEKPFNDQDLLDRIHQALRADAAGRALALQHQQHQALLDTLTQREREVLDCIVLGKSNKTIANGLGLSAKTVEVHRASLMAKMGAHSVADVVRIAMQHQIPASLATTAWSPD